MRRGAFVAIAIVWLFLAGCQSIVFYSTTGASNKAELGRLDYGELDARRKLLIDEAHRWIGVPYCLGGNDRCVDCSGLTQNVYAKVGIALPRTAQEQAKLGTYVDYVNLKVGDLLFFGSGSKVSHVAIYAGNGKVIHSTTNRGVVEESISAVSRNFLFAKRLLE
jgi:cell wall-associated NlpC family hydrolase